MGGGFLGDRFDVREPALGLFLLACILLLALLISLRRSPLPALLALLLVLGALRVEVFADDGPSALLAYHGLDDVQVEGVVVGDPEAAGAATRLRFDAERTKSGGAWTDAPGDVLVTLRESVEIVARRDKPYFRYGDRLLLRGRLDAQPKLEDFDYPAYLARQGIGSVMSFPRADLLAEGDGAPFYRWLYGVRRRVAESVAKVVPEPEASVGQALLLGLRDGLPEGLVDDFRETGTSHVLAISGLHVGILLGMTLVISQWALGRRRQMYLLPALALMWSYALVSGMSPSVTRAAIMGSVYLAALLLGRPRSVLPALGLAAAAMTLIDPDVLWHVSFQLSFAAMAGIAVLAEPLSLKLQALQHRLPPPATIGPTPSAPLPRASAPLLTPLSHIVAMTLAATVATLPLIAFQFQQVSLVGCPRPSWCSRRCPPFSSARRRLRSWAC